MPLDSADIIKRQIASENLDNHMKDHDRLNDFWKDVRKHSKSKSVLSNCIDGVTGETARRAKLGQIQGGGGCRGSAKIRQREGCNNVSLFTR